MLRRSLLAIPLMAAPLLSRSASAQTPARKVHIGQASSGISFVPLDAARTLGTFPAAGLDLYQVALPGGDPACLAALDSGDIDLAAISAEALLAAIANGQPFQIVATLLNKISLELIVSNKRIEQSGIAPADDPLDKRLSLLKNAVVGVSALGGTRDHATRWLARQAGLNPETDLHITVIGPAPALQAALEAGTIDAFILPPPEGLLAEDARTGQVLVRLGDEFPLLKNLPALVLAVKTPVSDETRTLTIATCKALIAAITQLLADPPAVAAQIASKLYPHLKPEVIAAAIQNLKTGLTTRGRIDPVAIKNLLEYTTAAPGLNTTEGGIWTNQFWDAAAT